MLYGASGYTGTLTAELAKRRGLTPVLAGRNRSKLEPLAERLGFELRVFDLERPDRVERELHGFQAVLHMAGPFRATSGPLVDACLRTGCHYLDITGEFPVFEAIWPRHAQAVQAGVALLPGVGFDVVPTDCLAALLHRALPDATELELAFAPLGTRPSPGTVNTWLDILRRPSLVRAKGQVVSEPLGVRTRRVPFPSRSSNAVAVPLGDLSSAFRSTGIPSITTYLAAPRLIAPALQGLGALRPVFASTRVERRLRRWVERAIAGPDARQRSQSRAELWGEVRNAAGHRAQLTLTTGDPYALTADTALRCLDHVLNGRVAPGASSPAQAFGADFVTQCEGVTLGRLLTHVT